MTVGDILKNYRTENKITQGKFSEKTGISKGYISMLENNTNARNGNPITPTLDTLRKIAFGMNITIDELLQLVDKNQEISLYEDTSTKQEPDLQKIIYCFNAMDNIGKEALVDQAEYLLIKHPKIDEPPAPDVSMEEMDERTRQYGPLEMPEGSMPDLLRRINSHKAKDA